MTFPPISSASTQDVFADFDEKFGINKPSPLETIFDLIKQIPLVAPTLSGMQQGTTVGELIPQAQLVAQVSAEVTKQAVKTLIVDPAINVGNSGAFLIDMGALGGEAILSTAKGIIAAGTPLGQVDQDDIMRLTAGLPPKSGYAPAKDVILNQLAKDLTFEDLPTEERLLRARRGFALIGGALASVGANTLLSTGASRLMETPIGGAVFAVGQKLAGKGGPIIAATTSGIMEGATFGATFGALEPLDAAGFSRSESIIYNAVGGAALMGFFRGIGAARYYSGERPHKEASTAATLAAKEIAKQLQIETLAQQSGLRPMPPVAATPEELVAQVAAGVNTQAVNRTSFIGRMGQAVEDFLQVRFPDVRKIDNSTWLSANKAVQARVPGFYMAEVFSRSLLDGLTDNEARVLGDAVFLSRMEAVGARISQDLARAQAEGNAKRIEKLAVQLAKVEGWGELPLPDKILFDNSPGIQRALKVAEETVSPTLTQIRFRNGARTYQETRLPFFPLVRATPEEIAAGAPVKFRGGGGESRVVGGPVIAKTTTGARQATGQGDAYITDIRTILARTFASDVNIDLHNELLANIITAPWAKRLKVIGKTSSGAPIYEKAPAEILVNGVTWPVKQVDLRGNRRVLDERFGLSGIKTVSETVTQQSGQRIAGALEPGGTHLPPGPGPIQPQLSRGLPSEVEGPMLKGFLGNQPPMAGLLGPGKTVGETLPRDLMTLEGLAEVEGTVVEPILGRYAVPEPIANMVNEVFLTNRKDFLQLKELDPIFRAMDFSIGLLLASPVEVTAHTMRITSILSENKAIGGELDRLIALMVPYLGPKFSALNSIYRVFDTPEGVQILNTLAAIPGALPSRFMQTEYQAGLGALLERVSPKAAKVGEAGRKFLFDLPEFGKGWHGYDIRARVVAANALKRTMNADLGRDPTSNEYLTHLKQFGIYTEEIQSNFVSFWRRNRLAPFAGLQSGSGPGEIRRLFGGLNLPKETIDELSTAAWTAWKGEVLWRGLIGTVTFTTLANKAMSGKWPWENEEGYMLDLNTGSYTHDGRAVYIPFQVLSSTLNRALTITAARAMLETLGDRSGYVDAATQRLANTPLTYLIGAAPGTQAALAFTLGRAPYLAGGELLSVSPPQPTDALTLKQRSMDALISTNPTLEAFFSQHNIETKGKLRFVDAVSPGLKVGRLPDQAITAGIRREFARDYEVVQDRVSRSLGLPLSERIDYLRKESQDFPEDKQTEMFRLMVGELRGRMRGLEISKARVRQRQ